jgi:hypothetical protein
MPIWIRIRISNTMLIQILSQIGIKTMPMHMWIRPKFSHVGKSEIYLPYKGIRDCSLFSEWPLICAL